MFRQRKSMLKPTFNLALGCKNTGIVVPSLVSQFLTENVTYFDGADKCEARCFVSDIYLLFNQRRLSSAGADTINAWLNTLTPKSDALAELRKKCSDEQLMQICKSRYIQSPSELLAWSEYLNANYSDLLSAAVQHVSDQRKQTEPEPAPSVTSE